MFLCTIIKFPESYETKLQTEIKKLISLRMRFQNMRFKRCLTLLRSASFKDFKPKKWIAHGFAQA